MKTILLSSLALVLALPVCAQETRDTEKRIADLEKKIEKLSAKKEEAKESGLSVKFGGRFHLDSTYFNGNENRLANGTFMRRARISFKVGMGKDWVGEGDVDFAEAIVNIKDMWVGYQGFKNSLIQVGQFKAPFGMDTLGSSNATWLMERSYSDMWTPDRHLGVGYSVWGERWQAKANFFGQAINDTADAQAAADAGGYKLVEDHGWGAAARVTFAPLLISDTKAIHLGVAAVQRTPNAGAFGAYEVDYSGRPEHNKVSKEKFLNLSMKNVDKTVQIGAEFAGVWKAFSWQSEYQRTNINRREAVGATPVLQAASVVDHKFSTYYGQVSWIFGGQRTYEVSDGLFGKVSPSSKLGALELVFRYSKMDQNDLTPIDPVTGGVASNMAVGLTWYTNKNLRWMLNYTKVDNGLNAMCNKAFSPTGVKLADDDFGFTSMRVQVNF